MSPPGAALSLPSPKNKAVPPPPSAYFDISRLRQLEGQFPPGFDRVQNSEVATLGLDAEKYFAVGVGDIVKVEPPLCRWVLQPVRPPQDAQYTMIGGLVGQGALLVGAVSSPRPLGKAAVPRGCEQVAVTQRAAGRQVVSTVTRQPGPPIDGIVTTESIATAQGALKSYVFAAFLSDTVAVSAEGVLPGNSDAEAVVSGMLVKAVNVIRAA